MTLTDFLLARIAEDEQEARDWKADRDELPQMPPWDDDWRYGPTRDLAEAEAKRRIVEMCDAISRTGGLSPDDDAAAVCLATMTYLSLPYADHPDYQQEWKP